VPTHFKLNNGVMMPSVGFGTYGVTKAEPIYNAIVHAGYRSVDTGSVMKSEPGVGEAIQ